MIDILTNTGTGWLYWLNVLLLLIVLALVIWTIFGFVKFAKLTETEFGDPAVKNKAIKTGFAKLLIRVVVSVLIITAIFTGYGSGTYDRELNPVENHSLNRDIMEAGDPPTKEELILDDLENTDKELLMVRSDSSLKKIEEENQKEIEETLKRYQ